ncbi:MAG TPA: metallophosphoesterase family protein, partial [Steroidobacteraceae bacterium]|nr:metallophosphoesterase family protein [Steroidobacteraceae bacterium]
PQPVLIYGHTHRPLIARVGDRLVVNPGSAGPHRFKLPSSVGKLRVRDGGVEAEILELPG